MSQGSLISQSAFWRFITITKIEVRMKITKTINPTKSSISQTVNRSDYSALMTLQIEEKRDVRAVPSELEKFIKDDLSAHTILVLKHRL